MLFPLSASGQCMNMAVGKMTATFIQSVLIIFTQGSSTKLLKENCISLVRARSSLSNQSANKV